MSRDDDQPRSLLNLLSNHDPNAVVLQDFVPMDQSLLWDASQSYWDASGAQSFIGGDVPFSVNNDGRLSEGAARVLFDLLEHTNGRRSAGPIFTADLGSGSGLFSKLFLDAFQRRCADAGRDYYQRLTHVVADASQAMLDGMEGHALFDAHRGHALLVRASAEDLIHEVGQHQDAAADFPGFTAVLLNYLLDVLPTTAFRGRSGKVELLHMRTSVSRQLPADGESDVPNFKERSLYDVWRNLVFDLEYRPYSDNLRLAGKPLQMDDGDVLVWNTGAIACLDALTEALQPGGCILINDYGHPGLFSTEPYPPVYHYGGSVSSGLNFGVLKAAVEARRGFRWTQPAEDSSMISVRLVGRDLDAGLCSTLVEHVGGREYTRLTAPLEQARKAVADGRYASARVFFADAIALQPHNWRLQYETGAFLLDHCDDPAAALQFAESGLQHNPIAPELWNLLGECELKLGRPAEARSRFEHVLTLNPRGARGRSNLAKALLEAGCYREALQAIAEGFLSEPSAGQRDDLLRTQQRVLDALSSAQERDRTARLNRVRRASADT